MYTSQGKISDKQLELKSIEKANSELLSRLLSLNILKPQKIKFGFIANPTKDFENLFTKVKEVVYEQ